MIKRKIRQNPHDPSNPSSIVINLSYNLTKSVINMTDIKYSEVVDYNSCNLQ